MNSWKIIFFACFAALIAVPVFFRPARSVDVASAHGGEAWPLIIITPHNEQIRYEFKRAFEAWHVRNFGRAVNVIYNVPGGTSEIRKMLESQFTAALTSGRQPGGDADLVFGGGTFEHGRLKRGVRIVIDGVARDEPISAPIDFSDEFLQRTYGDNIIGDDPLYDPDRHWFGLALSGFGIVYNRDALRTLSIAEPTNWPHLCNPQLQGWVALVNPSQSGSVTTAFESIFKRVGWEQGWRILRRAGANSRYFSASALKPPIDVSQGNAAMGVCIDFFGRYQSQALKEAGDPERIGYIDPPGVPLDADPISLLRRAPNPELARRFIEFCLSEEGQALWQFPKREPGRNADLGPDRFELRRLPIVRAMYERYFDRFVDQVNPFELAQPAAFPDDNVRDFIAPLFAAMVMDTHRELKHAWHVIAAHPAMSDADGLASSESVTDPTLKRMLELFDAMPSLEGPQGRRYPLADASNLGVLRAGWFRDGWQHENLWHAEASPADDMRRRCGEFFRENYRHIVELAEPR